MAGVLLLLCPTGPALYFCGGQLTHIWRDLPVGQRMMMVV
jgi:hypothetical protein